MDNGNVVTLIALTFIGFAAYRVLRLPLLGITVWMGSLASGFMTALRSRMVKPVHPFRDQMECQFRANERKLEETLAERDAQIESMDVANAILREELRSEREAHTTTKRLLNQGCLRTYTMAWGFAGIIMGAGVVLLFVPFLLDATSSTTTEARHLTEAPDGNATTDAAARDTEEPRRPSIVDVEFFPAQVLTRGFCQERSAALWGQYPTLQYRTIRSGAVWFFLGDAKKERHQTTVALILPHDPAP